MSSLVVCWRRQNECYLILYIYIYIIYKKNYLTLCKTYVCVRYRFLLRDHLKFMLMHVVCVYLFFNNIRQRSNHRKVHTQMNKTLPSYVQEEFEAYLKCGRLEHGFLRWRKIRGFKLLMLVV